LLDSPAIPYSTVSDPLLERKNITLLVKRLDLVHPLISGNKFFKLKYNIEAAKQAGYKTLLTFGGAFSNHIHAAAEAARLEGMSIVGVIRGEETLPLNPTLLKAKECGMELYYLSRSAYRDKSNPEFTAKLRERFEDFYLIPEGGTNSLAIKGTREILQDDDFSANIITCSIGTGGTIAGVIAAAKKHQQVWGFSSLRGDFIHEDIRNLLSNESISPDCQYKIYTDYHFGGYGKHKPELLDFIKDFHQTTDIPLDPVYTGKMMYGVWDRLEQIPEGSKILCLHTGGLQGIAGFNRRFGTDLSNK